MTREVSPRTSIEEREHYPYVTRSLIRLYNTGVLTNIASIDVEPDYGYVTRLTYLDGSHRITYGNDLGLNTGASSDLAKDKGHTKFILRTIGINCPKGDEFLLPWWAKEISPTQQQRGNDNIKTTDMAEHYLEEQLGFPAYIKPVSGSKGLGVEKIFNVDELNATIETYNENRVRVAIIEEPVEMPDYRVVMLDGELISAYQRLPLSVPGDGHSTIEDLITRLQERFITEGRDTRLNSQDARIARHLGRQGLTLADVLPLDSTATLIPISNLSVGGTAEDITNTIHPHWVNLATYVASNFNLRLCGVDLACLDIEDQSSPYSVLEVNAAPGLDHYASSGEAQKQVVNSLYAKVLNAPLSPHTTS